MPSFTTRIELHDANYQDYERLHAEMARQGFSRFITSDKGVRFHLPTAEYDISGNLTLQQVFDRADTATKATGKESWILVTQADGRIWRLSAA